ncbi:hypothetical protein KKI24_17040 [bacterium]|nr:hypothetical protein [bacterium]
MAKKTSAVGTGLKEIIGGDEPIDRSMIAGWTAEEVSSLLAKGKPTEKDLAKATDRLSELYDSIDQYEATTKREIYLILSIIYNNRERLLDERYAKYFPQYLIDKCGVNESTAYKDAKVVWFLNEWGYIDILADDEKYKQYEKKFKQVVKKLRIIAYKPDQIKEKYKNDPKLLGQGVEAIQAEGLEPERAKWIQSPHIAKFAIMPTKGEVTKIKIKDKSLREDVQFILKNLNRDNLEEIKALLKK